VSYASAISELQTIEARIASLAPDLSSGDGFSTALAQAHAKPVQDTLGPDASATPPSADAAATASADTALTTADASATRTLAAVSASDSGSTSTSSSSAADASPYDDLIVQAAQANGIDPALLKGVVREESDFDPNAVSSVGAVGLGQLMPSTAASLGVTDPRDPEQNLMGAARLLHQELTAFGGDETLALAAYGAGEGAVRRYGGVPPFSEVQAAIPKEQAFIAQYRADGFGQSAPLASSTAVGAQAAAASGTASATAQKAVASAESMLGTPYHFGAETPGYGFDCSGLVQWAYAQDGVSLPRIAADQANAGVPVARDQLQPGDLVYFKNSTGYVHHIGMYVGGGNFIEAPHTGDVVKVASLSEPYYAAEYAGARRVA
jgi:cell wall-associated NlpC family hydrolase